MGASGEGLIPRPRVDVDKRLAPNKVQGQGRAGGDECGGGQGNHPREGDRLHEPPVCGTIHNADAQDRADQDVGGAHRQAQHRRGHDHQRGR